MNLKKALLAASVLALPVAAQAQTTTVAAPAYAPISGLYIGAAGGLNWLEGTHDQGIKLKPQNPGGIGLGYIGWGFGNGLRLEVEGDYRTNEVRRWQAVGASSGKSGYIDSYGVMVNALYDFNLGSPFVPYIGAGLGYIWTDIRNARATARPGTAAATTYQINDVEANMGYQGIVGGAYNFGGGLALTIEYRIFGTLTNTYGVLARGPNLDKLPSSIKPEYLNHGLLIGVRYAFNQPAPALVAAPVAPAAASTYLVFFDWDRYDLTTRARQIIAEAAAAARSKGSARIEVAGHADRSGTVEYNQRLSQRRADAVAAQLVRDGIAKNEIAVSAYGESRPLVPTADGVREPQNRRVEIVLR